MEIRVRSLQKEFSSYTGGARKFLADHGIKTYCRRRVDGKMEKVTDIWGAKKARALWAEYNDIAKSENPAVRSHIDQHVSLRDLTKECHGYLGGAQRILQELGIKSYMLPAQKEYAYDKQRYVNWLDAERVRSKYRESQKEFSEYISDKECYICNGKIVSHITLTHEVQEITFLDKKIIRSCFWAYESEDGERIYFCDECEKFVVKKGTIEVKEV